MLWLSLVVYKTLSVQPVRFLLDVIKKVYWFAWVVLFNKSSSKDHLSVLYLSPIKFPSSGFSLTYLLQFPHVKETNGNAHDGSRTGNNDKD